MKKRRMPWYFRGWEVELESGEQIFEGEREWKEVPKKEIVRLSLHFDGRSWHLKDKDAYFVKNKGSMVPGVPDSFRIEERSIGWYEDGNKKCCYTIDEHTGMFKMGVL